jgi:hypothetical protein
MHFSRRSGVVAVLLGAAVGGTVSGMLACGSFSEDSPPDVTAADGGVVEGSVGPEAAPVPACDPAKVASDPFHCGRCDHSCLGGACAAGTCQPVVLGRSRGENVFDLAVDATHVLWITSSSPQSGPGHLWACPKSGCGAAAPLSLANEGQTPGNLGGDGVNAYASFVYGFHRITQVDTAGTLTTLATGDRFAAQDLQVLGGKLFYHSRFEQSALDGGRAGSLYSWDGKSELPFGKYDGFDNLNQFAATTTGRGFLASYGVIKRCEAGGVCQPFAGVTDGIVGFTANGTRVYWSDGTGKVVSCASAGPCPPFQTELGPAQLKGQALALSHDHGVLYVTTSSGDLFACDPSQCAASVKLVAHEPRFYTGDEYSYGHSVVADDRAIYWVAIDGTGPVSDAGEDTSNLTHRIMKLAK